MISVIRTQLRMWVISPWNELLMLIFFFYQEEETFFSFQIPLSSSKDASDFFALFVLQKKKTRLAKIVLI